MYREKINMYIAFLTFSSLRYHACFSENISTISAQICQQSERIWSYNIFIDVTLYTIQCQRYSNTICFLSREGETCKEKHLRLSSDTYWKIMARNCIKLNCPHKLHAKTNTTITVWFSLILMCRFFLVN